MYMLLKKEKHIKSLVHSLVCSSWLSILMFVSFIISFLGKDTYSQYIGVLSGNRHFLVEGRWYFFVIFVVALFASISLYKKIK